MICFGTFSDGFYELFFFFLSLGKYPVTTGIWPGVFSANSLGGLDPSHPTLASRLAKIGYRTAHVGKWHLGVGEYQQYLPTR